MRTITIGMKIKALGRCVLLMVILKNVQYNVINEFRGIQPEFEARCSIEVCEILVHLPKAKPLFNN
jgi:hypothetical protein